MLGIGMRGFGSMAKPQNKTGEAEARGLVPCRLEVDRPGLIVVWRLDPFDKAATDTSCAPCSKNTASG
jgi:hypothetical protein